MLFTALKAGQCAPACMHGAGVECIQILPPPYPPIAAYPPASQTQQLPITASGKAGYGPPAPVSPPAVYTLSVFGSTDGGPGLPSGYSPPPGFVRGYGYIGSGHTTGGGYTTVFNNGGSGKPLHEAKKAQSIQSTVFTPITRTGESRD